METPKYVCSAQNDSQLHSDTVEVVQKVEFDEQIHCKVRMREVCGPEENDQPFVQQQSRPRLQPAAQPKRPNEAPRSFTKSTENFLDSGGGSDQKCRTENRRECRTVFEPQATLVKVRICPDDIDGVVDPKRRERLEATYFSLVEHTNIRPT